MEHKTLGNKLYSQENYSGAISAYTSGINQEVGVGTGVVKKEEGEEGCLHILYANRCQCYLTLDEPEKGLWDAERAIEQKSDYGKAHIRRVIALLALLRFKEALSAITTANASLLAASPAGGEDVAALQEILKGYKQKANSARTLEDRFRSIARKYEDIKRVYAQNPTNPLVKQQFSALRKELTPLVQVSPLDVRLSAKIGQCFARINCHLGNISCGEARHNPAGSAPFLASYHQGVSASTTAVRMFGLCREAGNDYHARGVAHSNLGNYELAVLDFERAMKLLLAQAPFTLSMLQADAAGKVKGGGATLKLLEIRKVLAHAMAVMDHELLFGSEPMTMTTDELLHKLTVVSFDLQKINMTQLSKQQVDQWEEDTAACHAALAYLAHQREDLVATLEHCGVAFQYYKPSATTLDAALTTTDSWVFDYLYLARGCALYNTTVSTHDDSSVGKAVADLTKLATGTMARTWITRFWVSQAQAMLHHILKNSDGNNKAGKKNILLPFYETGDEREKIAQMLFVPGSG